MNAILRYFCAHRPRWHDLILPRWRAKGFGNPQNKWRFSRHPFRARHVLMLLLEQSRDRHTTTTFLLYAFKRITAITSSECISLPRKSLARYLSRRRNCGVKAPCFRRPRPRSSLAVRLGDFDCVCLFFYFFGLRSKKLRELHVGFLFGSSLQQVNSTFAQTRVPTFAVAEGCDKWRLVNGAFAIESAAFVPTHPLPPLSLNDRSVPCAPNTKTETRLTSKSGPVEALPEVGVSHEV